MMKSMISQTSKPVKSLFESERCNVTRDGNTIELSQYGPWAPDYTRLAKRYKINALHISEIYKQEWASLNFLHDLPPLRRLHVVLARPADLSPVARLSGLHHLAIMGDIARDDDPVPAVDFSRLKKLQSAYVEIAAPTISLLKCKSLESLWIWDQCQPAIKELDLSVLTQLRELHITAWTKLSSLDLSHQPALHQLHIEALPKLKDVSLHPKSKIRQFKVGGCGPYRIDWKRLGSDLQELELTGPLRFPIQDVLRAPNLRSLGTNGIRKFPPLGFLLKLRHLKKFEYWTTPPEPKWSAADKEVMRKIDARSKPAKTPA